MILLRKARIGFPLGWKILATEAVCFNQAHAVD